MTMLAEVSDKVVSTGQFCTVMAVLSVAVGAIAVASRWWAALLIAVSVAALGCVFTLSFLDDPVLGDAVFQENGWSWFASNLAASVLPLACVVIAVVWRGRAHRRPAGFEVVQSVRPPMSVD
jgi:hypothetical protein